MCCQKARTVKHNNRLDCHRIWILSAIPNGLFIGVPIVLKALGVVSWSWRVALMPLALSVLSALFLVGIIVLEERKP